MSNEPPRGFSLIELVIVIVVLATALTGVISAFLSATARSADPMLQQQALIIAEGYLEEIMGKAWGDCSTPTRPALSRSLWERIDAYHGLDEEPTDLRGERLDGLSDYRVQVTMQSASALASGACEISVVVSHRRFAEISERLQAWRLPD
jgi:MSHA pilin protein MshD